MLYEYPFKARAHYAHVNLHYTDTDCTTTTTKNNKRKYLKTQNVCISRLVSTTRGDALSNHQTRLIHLRGATLWCGKGSPNQIHSTLTTQSRLHYSTLSEFGKFKCLCFFFPKSAPHLTGCVIWAYNSRSRFHHTTPQSSFEGVGGEGEGCCSVFVYMMLGFAVIEAPSGSMDLAGGSVIRSAN